MIISRATALRKSLPGAGITSCIPWEIDPDGKVYELLSLRRVAQELNGYCGETGIEERWAGDIMAWREVSRLYSEIVRDCPLSMSRKGHVFHYVAKLEIDGCEPSEAIVQSEPAERAYRLELEVHA